MHYRQISLFQNVDTSVSSDSANHSQITTLNLPPQGSRGMGKRSKSLLGTMTTMFGTKRRSRSVRGSFNGDSESMVSSTDYQSVVDDKEDMAAYFSQSDKLDVSTSGTYTYGNDDKVQDITKLGNNNSEISGNGSTSSDRESKDIGTVLPNLTSISTSDKLFPKLSSHEEVLNTTDSTEESQADSGIGLEIKWGNSTLKAEQISNSVEESQQQSINQLEIIDESHIEVVLLNTTSTTLLLHMSMIFLCRMIYHQPLCYLVYP